MITKLGSKQEVDGNPQALGEDVAAERVMGGFYPTTTNENQFRVPYPRPTIAINGDNGSVDIGGRMGNTGRDGKVILRDGHQRIKLVIDGQTGTIRQLGDLRLAEGQAAAGSQTVQNVRDRIRLSGREALIIIQTPNGDSVVRLDGEAEIALDVARTARARALKIKTQTETQSLKVSTKAEAGELDVAGQTETSTLKVRAGTETESLKVNQQATVTELEVSGATETSTLKVKTQTETTGLKVADRADIAQLEVSGLAEATTLKVQTETETKSLTVDQLA
ncbi:MAG: hypothetical protein JXA14_27765, partial [Anaerolineae bacterium]|nr:hypothetical protein [Anaerolineae bacterium]